MAFSLPPSLSFIQKKRETGAQKKSNSINRTFYILPTSSSFPRRILLAPLLQRILETEKKNLYNSGGKTRGEKICVHPNFRIRAHLVFRPGFSALSLFAGLEGEEGAEEFRIQTRIFFALLCMLCANRVRELSRNFKKKVPLPNGDFPSHEYEHHQPSY